MLGMRVSGNPKVITDAVSRALQLFVESDVIAGAVRAELLRSPARDDPVHFDLLPSRLRPASALPSFSVGSFLMMRRCAMFVEGGKHTVIPA
eukprot:87928-Pyramimonas_sp.AAC.1